MSAMLPPGLHSQQAGTILPTLMLIPRARPPLRCAGWCLQFPRSCVARMIRDSIFSARDCFAQADFKNGGGDIAQERPGAKLRVSCGTDRFWNGGPCRGEHHL